MAKPSPTATPQMTPQQQNYLARQAVLNRAVEMTQSVFNQNVFPPSNPVLQVQPRNVGLIKRFVIEVAAVLTNTSAAVATLTDFGAANLLSQISFTDLNNNVRVQTTGAHLTLLAGAKRRRPYASSGDFNTANGNSISQIDNVVPAAWPVLTAPQTIAAGAAGTVRAVFELPLAYSDDDLRGGVFAAVINAVMQLQLTFNQNPFNANDSTNAVYSGAGVAGVFTSAQVNINQVYLDQLPVGNKGTILPVLDLSTVYELKNTSFTAFAPNNDNPIPYANFRDFFSVFLVYNNSGLSAGRNFGSDINYLALQSANFTNIWKVGALYQALQNREVLGADLPAGTYYMSHRRKPINTTQYGNMELIVNPSVATANMYAQVFWEDMALSNTLTAAGSLAG